MVAGRGLSQLATAWLTGCVRHLGHLLCELAVIDIRLCRARRFGRLAFLRLVTASTTHFPSLQVASKGYVGK